MYVAFHREMTNRGFYMLPLNLKRNHLTAAHTEEDVDSALTAADDVLTLLAARSARKRG
jgi:glutamate-1-semialdehyde aminotransferase